MAYARIVHHWDAESATCCDDQPGHPDLLDELATRVLTMWRETCGGAVVTEDEDEA